jgi:DNA-binding transcriptional LysR family regulator
MKIDELRILAAVFQEPNLSKVATHLKLSQSNLSKIIKRSEDELGFQLFERKGFQGLKPTPQGRIFAERIQTFSRSWEDTVALAKNYEERKVDVKVTGPSLYMRNVFMPRWFANGLQERYRLSYVQSRIDQISLTAQAGDIDLVITPSPFELLDWVPIPIFTESFAVFSSRAASNSLAKLDVKNKNWLGYRAANDVSRHYFHENQISPKQIIAFIDDVEVILDLVASDPSMLAILPAHAMNAQRKLRVFPINKSRGQHLYLTYRQGQPGLHDAVKTLKSVLVKE